MHADSMAGVLRYKAHASADARGSVVQVISPDWCARMCTVHNDRAKTLRGLHFQHPAKSKIVTCTAGEVFDVLVDLRVNAETHLHWTSFYLLPGDAILIPPGLAHGYMTLTDDTSLLYLLEGDRHDDCGIRWDDPKIGIKWPTEPETISERDRAWSCL